MLFHLSDILVSGKFFSIKVIFSCKPKMWKHHHLFCATFGVEKYLFWAESWFTLCSSSFLNIFHFLLDCWNQDKQQPSMHPCSFCTILDQASSIFCEGWPLWLSLEQSWNLRHPYKTYFLVSLLKRSSDAQLYLRWRKSTQRKTHGKKRRWHWEVQERSCRPWQLLLGENPCGTGEQQRAKHRPNTELTSMSRYTCPERKCGLLISFGFSARWNLRSLLSIGCCGQINCLTPFPFAKLDRY